MSTITKEWLQQKIADMEATRDEIPFGLDEDDSNTLAALRIALASLEAEAVAYVDPHAFNNFSAYRAGETDSKRMGREWMWANPDAGLIPVYTVPPEPVSVPDEDLLHMAASAIECLLSNKERSCAGVWADIPAKLRRAAMLQGADGNSPVISDGWALVPIEPTAEMISSGIAAHYERSQIQIHDRPAPGPMECAYVAMLAAAPDFREIGNSSTNNFREIAETSTNCPCCGRKPLKNKTCSVAGCDDKHVARGLCAKHYAIERKNDPSRRESIRAADKRYRARKAEAPQQEAE